MCGMCGTCSIICGVLVLAAGLGMSGLVSALGGAIPGYLFVLYGLGLLVHALGLCPMCKGKCKCD